MIFISTFSTAFSIPVNFSGARMKHIIPAKNRFPCGFTLACSLEIIINQTIEFAPIVILGADPMVIPIKALLDAMFGMFIHANVNVKFGKLKYIFNSPELHLWHHANYREVFHANFSTKFSVWDYLFGTVYDPGH